MTPREIYERMKRGEDIGNKMDAGQAAAAKAILRRQAGTLTKEHCLMRTYFAENDTNPWTCSLVFSNGELSKTAQATLTRMQNNAHETMLMNGNHQSTIMFFVYTIETDNA